ncbi:MAG: MurR/RpiR family transcriptional regulator [Pseudomonadota bacterium]
MQARIAAELQELPAAEARVGEWILAHPRETVRASVRRVARAAGTSEPTVIRFCRRFGLPGYRELKLRLAAEIGASDSPMHGQVTVADSPTAAARKVIDQSVAALKLLREHSVELPFAEAATALAAARQVIFAGEGASGQVAADAWQKFFRLGRPCSYANDEPTIRQLAAVTAATDVLVAISHTGESTTLSGAIQLAKAKGALTIAISRSGSPLMRNVDLGFPCSADEDTSLYTPMSSRLVHLAVFDALFVTLALTLGDSAVAALNNAKSALRPSAVQETSDPPTVD